MTEVVLRPHPDGGSTPMKGISVEVARAAPARLGLRYMATGDMDRLSVPGPGASARTDDLWKHTCFEAFLGQGGDRYWEINLAPSSEWAAYAFSGYRQRSDDPELAAPSVQTAIYPGTLILTAELDLSTVEGLDPTAAWTLGLSAVIEDKAGERSYWALAHPPGKPDFHHKAAFTLHLPPPDRP